MVYAGSNPVYSACMNEFDRISFDDNPLMITFSNLETGKLTHANASFITQTGYAYEELVGNSSIELGIIDASIKAEMEKDISGKMELSCGEILLRRKDKTSFWVNYFGRIVEIDRHKYYFSVAHDITTQKEYERQLEKQLKEKEIILREVHHRIKNNLASIESLLSIQQSYSPTDDSRNVLEGSIGKLRSARIIYEKLLYSNDFRNLALGDYLRDLTTAIGESHASGKNIRVSFRTNDAITMLSNTTFLVGIMVNELVMNSIKYAFPEGNGGDVGIHMDGRDGRLMITVRDNGTGIPLGDDGHPAAGNGFGLPLVDMLAEQMKGTVSFYNENGTVCTISLPVA